MRKDNTTEQVKVCSLSELDALVCEHVMEEVPEIHWEDSYVHFRFASLDEALNSMKDPYFQHFIPEEARSSTVLSEVREFRSYSSEMVAALDVVERLSSEQGALNLRRKSHGWAAAFGSAQEVLADTAPAAICLAALRFRGLDVGVEVVRGAAHFMREKAVA